MSAFSILFPSNIDSFINANIIIDLDVHGQGIVAQALFLGDTNQFNSSRDDCLWKRGNERDSCPDEDINIILYTASPNSRRTMVNDSVLINFVKKITKNVLKKNYRTKTVRKFTNLRVT